MKTVKNQKKKQNLMSYNYGYIKEKKPMKRKSKSEKKNPKRTKKRWGINVEQMQKVKRKKSKFQKKMSGDASYTILKKSKKEFE